MKIVLLQDDFPPESKGGAGTMVATLARALQQLGHEVTVVSSTQKRIGVGLERWNGIPVYRIFSTYNERWRGYRSLYNRDTVAAVRKLLRDLQPDIVHAHNIHQYLSYWALFLAKRTGAEVMLTAHDEMLFHYGKFSEYRPGHRPYSITAWQLLKRFKRRFNPFRQFFIKQCMRRVQLIAISREQANVLEDNGFRVDSIVYNGTYVEAATTAEVATFVEKYKLSGRNVVLFAGRISKLKGAEQAQKIMRLVRARVPQALLLIAGAEGKNTESSTYTGWLDTAQMRAAYGASDVVLFPSIYFDPFGLINIEAMASRRPVVATTYGGAPEIVRDGITGYIEVPMKEEVFADKVALLLENPTLAQKFGEAGYKRVQECFTAERMAREYVSLYQPPI